MKKHSKEYIKRLVDMLHSVDLDKLDLLKKKLRKMRHSGHVLFICGNGGSAATSSHMACDLAKTILGKKPREYSGKRLKAMSLNDAIPLMTAWSNDEGYEHIFSQQLAMFGKKGDMLLVITGSGNSKNILEVVQKARDMDIYTFGLLGFNGGKVKDILHDSLVIESNDYGLVEDAHHIINHLVADFFKQELV